MMQGGDFSQGKARSSQDALVHLGLPWVRRMAFRMARRLPPNVEVDDLIGAGTEGLLRAVQSYDPSINPNFEPYAKTRIRGAMLDALREFDPMTRYGRRLMAKVSATHRELERELGRVPEESEVAARLEMSLENYRQVLEEFSRVPALAQIGADPDEVEGVNHSPESLISSKEMRGLLVRSIARLPKNSQTVLALYYQEELTQAEIAKVLQITDSRVCQILGEATLRLRSSIEKELRGAKRPAIKTDKRGSELRAEVEHERERPCRTGSIPPSAAR